MTKLAVAEKKSFFGMLKSGVIIAGGLYGYLYATGQVEDINQYHVSYLKQRN